MKKYPKIYVAGHSGMVGSALLRKLELLGNKNIIFRSHAELDLTNQAAVANFFATEKPDQVYLAAAKVGGIYANSVYPAEFIYQNLTIQTNVIHQAFISGVSRLLFLGSSCIYPRLAEQPIKEGALLSGNLEPTNEPYAIAKIAGIKLCESYNRQYGETHGIDYRSVMPTNLYGPGDYYHPDNSHVIPALITKFHEAKIRNIPKVIVWGTGTPRREFLYVDDLADASIFLMDKDKSSYEQYVDPMQSHINIGSGSDIPISDLAHLISRVVGYSGMIGFDSSRPDGAPRKLMSSEKLFSMGWAPVVDLNHGLHLTYQSFLRESAEKC